MFALSFLAPIFEALPTIVAGVETLHTEASGVTKQQLAVDSVSVLTSTLTKAVPGADSFANEIDAILKAGINLTVAGFNAAGTFVHKAPAQGA